MNELTVVTDRDLRVTALSRSLRDLLEPDVPPSADLLISELFTGEDRFKVAAAARDCAHAGEPADLQVSRRGATYRVQLQALHGVAGSIVGVLGNAHKIGYAVRNLPDRALLEERLSAAIARARRSGRLCALLLVDVEGHEELLAEADARLRHCVRLGDLVLRIGSGEFAIILDSVANNHEAHEGARAIVAGFAGTFESGGSTGRLCASIGLSIFPFTAGTPAELIRAAGEAMCAVKKNGGNGFELARPQVPARDASKVHAACVTSSAVREHFVPGESGLVSG